MRAAIATVLPLFFCATLAAQWSIAGPPTSPGNRAGHAMAGDGLGNVVLFGGTAAFAPTNQTWRFDGFTWTQLAPAAAPTARSLASLVHDPVRGRYVLYGGWTSAVSIGTASNQTWEFDGANWTQVVPPTSPPGLWKHGACFDAARNRVVVYGGARNGFPIAENATWEFQGANWTQVATTSNPGPLERPAMCYATAFGYTVLFGGVDPQTGGSDATWSYNGASWQVLPIVGPRPPARGGAQLAYDSIRNVCVLTGGLDPVTGTPCTDTWELDGGTWTLLPGSFAPGRDFGLAFDPVRRFVVRHGGIAGAATNGQTWLFGARSDLYGAGCPGSNGVPALTAGDGPRLGAGWPLTLANANLNAPVAALVLGLANAPGVPLDGIGMPGCTAWASADVLLVAPAPNGAAAWSVQLPANAGLVGVQLYAQGLSLDLGWNPAGLVSSNAVDGLAGR
ncbi:MAG: hypothetical protein ACK56S_10160 [Planctomycetota bacterium]